MKLRTFLLLVFFFPLSRAAAATATGVTQPEVQAAINATADGGTVIIPAGSANWSTGVTNSRGLTLQGAGIGQTIITVTADHANIQLTQHPTIVSRITGIEFHGSFDNPRPNINISCNNGSSDAPFRIDHCKFVGTTNPVFMQIYGGGGVQGRGLIDHCDFTVDGPPTEMLHNNGYGSGSTTGWAYTVVPGSDDALYIEDCTFFSGSSVVYSNAIQTYYGGRTVFRHNQLDMCQVDVHGTPGAIGGRWFEIYDNTYTTHAGDNQPDYMSLRAGSGAVFNNTHTGPTSGSIKLEEENNGIDGGLESYPAAFQIGRGINQSTTFPYNQASYPLYLWNNTDNGGSMSIGVTPNTQAAGLIQLNRDYFVAVKPSYTAYAYPHPLQGAVADTTPPTLGTPTINSAGTTLTLPFSEAVQAGTGGNSGWTISASGGAATLSFASGTGSPTVLYSISRPIQFGESVTVSYLQPGNGIEDLAGNDLASRANVAVTNNSTQSAVATPVITLTAGPYFGTQITAIEATAGASVFYTVNGSTPTAASTPYTGPVTIAANLTLKAIATKAGNPNSPIASSAYEVLSWVSTGATFKTFSIPQQTGAFIWSFSVVAPSTGATSDCVVGLGPSAVSVPTGMACIIAFLGNNISVRNGASYTTGPTYSPGANYNFVASVDATAHTYSVTVTPAAGGATTTIVTGAAFRTEQAGASQLSYVGIQGNTGTITVSNMTFPAGPASARYIGLRGVPVAGGATP